MATILIEIIDLRREHDDNFAPIIASMSQLQSEFHFSFLDRSKANDLFLAIREETDIEDFSLSFFQKKEHWRGYHPFIICLFDSPISSDGVGNLFSVDISSKGFAAL